MPLITKFPRQTVDPAVLTDEMTLADVFCVAKKNEEAAMKMYQKLAIDSTSEDSQRLVESLAVMEQGHKVKMEEYYTDEAYAEVLQLYTPLNGAEGDEQILLRPGLLPVEQRVKGGA